MVPPPLLENAVVPVVLVFEVGLYTGVATVKGRLSLAASVRLVGALKVKITFALLVPLTVKAPTDPPVGAAAVGDTTFVCPCTTVPKSRGEVLVQVNAATTDALTVALS